jgi:hypothetical protein
MLNQEILNGPPIFFNNQQLPQVLDVVYKLQVVLMLIIIVIFIFINILQGWVDNHVAKMASISIIVDNARLEIPR